MSSEPHPPSAGPAPEGRPGASRVAGPPLRGLRVLDLTDERGLLCGKILADLGADVVHVEPPGGSSARRIPPAPLWWEAYAGGQRSITLDLEHAGRRRQLVELAREADVLVESFAPGFLAARDLGAATLEQANPRLVVVSISPFGQTGPRAADAASDLTVWAAAGPLALLGDEDRPPVRLPVPQAFLHAGADAAVAALIALHERERSGLGQQVDVSAQQSALVATQSYCLCDALGAPQATRTAGGLRLGSLFHRLIYPARDGFVAITFHFGSAIGPFSARLMRWIHEQGGCDAATAGKDWLRYTELLLSGEEPRSEYERVLESIARFTATRTKADLLAAAVGHGLLIAPVATIDEVASSEQLAARGFWCDVDTGVPGAAPLRVPGAFARFSRTPLRDPRPAPRPGEHTAEVLERIGQGDEGLLAADASAVVVASPTSSRPPAVPHPAPAGSRPAAVPGPAPRPTPTDRALTGVKILDFLWVIAGPTATRGLADFGATVVRVESSRKLDTARTLAPYVGGQPGPERSACFHNLNVGKRMIALDPTTAEGREVVLDLVRWADVVCESFQPGTLERWRLGPEELRAVKPDVILLRTSLMGQTGPLSRFAGYGNLAAAISGFSNLGGWPDRPPAGPFAAYTDYVTPRFLAVSILAALRHRQATGEGQDIDVSQSECSLQFLAPALLDWSAHRRLPRRCGNEDAGMAPHGVYPARSGHEDGDGWVAVAVPDDACWRALAGAIGRQDLAADPALAGAAGRLAARDRLDAALSAWTRERDRRDVEAILQRHRVPAAVVQNSRELVHDPQLVARRHFRELATEPPGAGPARSVVEGPRFVLGRTPGAVGEALPTLGRDSTTILRDLLGYDDDRITRVVLAGALE